MEVQTFLWLIALLNQTSEKEPIFLELVQVSLEIDAFRFSVLFEKPLIAHWVSVAADWTGRLWLLCQKSPDVIRENTSPSNISPLFAQSRYLPSTDPSKVAHENTNKSLTWARSKCTKVQHIPKPKKTMSTLCGKCYIQPGIFLSQQTACIFMIRHICMLKPSCQK